MESGMIKIKTRKLYYEDMFLKECEGTVIDITDNGIVFDQTVAYPEGGGQIGDRGILVINNMEIPFTDTKKGIGRIFYTDDFPTIQVDTPVIHIVSSNDLAHFQIGDKVKIKIDVQHRIKTTILHSGLHIALMAARERCPEITKTIKGCSITTESGRLDFFTHDKFTNEDIVNIQEKAQSLIDENLEISTYPYPGQDEAWYWKCKDFICPCGGTHVKNTGDLGKITVKRKNIGKTTERLIVTLSDELLTSNNYHS